MKRKSQGLSVTTIIVAAIALIVLVVLIAIFTGRLGVFSEGIDSCTNIGGECKGFCSTNEQQTTSATCDKKGELCCIPIPGEDQQ